MTKKKIYITTPIYYVNSVPHAGSAYTTILADILTRWHKLSGNEVFFLTGTDEHGKKIQETAEKEGLKPKEFTDKISKEFKKAWTLLNIKYDNFIRTTDKYHEKEVKKIFNELYSKKLIYKGFYESYYCVGCEQYKTKTDLVDGKCPLHKTVPEFKKEEAYLLKLSKFQKQIFDAIKKDKLKILPVKRKNEMISFIKQGLHDISVSRRKEDVSWGIELPFDKNHTSFVWVDAFYSYWSGLRNKKKFWPPTVQLMANDILRVHATIWPTILLGLGKKLPRSFFIHGYFTVNGQKMSKSLGNVVDPITIANKYGADSLRYYFVKEISLGEDGDFSEQKLIDRYNNELANDLGNLVSRSLTLAVKFKGKIEGKQELKLDIKKIEKLFENYEINQALDEIWSFIKSVNKYVNDKKPWGLEGKKLSNVLYNILESLRIISILISPFIPETAEKICKGLNLKLGKLKDCKFRKVNYKIKLIPHLFEKIDAPKPINKEKIVGVITMDKIRFSDWQKLDLRVGKIKGVKDHPNAEKLYILLVDIGPIEQNIQLVAGLKQHYKKEELMGKKVIVFRNLEPAVIRGEESAGMVLAAVKDNKVVLITPDKDIDLGAKIQ